tara:strand:+ start:16 stop:1413 length:1398 start_codon:yes stop_codon:yes gene_type:complete
VSRSNDLASLADEATGGITKAEVGLGNVDNTSDANKPVSTAQQTALDAKAPTASPTFTGTVSGVTKTHVGLGNVDNESKSTMFSSPTFTGTVSGVTKTHVGLSNVTNDAQVPASGGAFTGNVGIGTGANIDQLLHVESNANTYIQTETTSGTGASGIIAKGTGSTFYVYNQGSSDNLRIFEDSGCDVNITPAGNVDIGGASHPARKFSIKGSANDNSENTIEVLNSDSTTTFKLLSNGNLEIPAGKVGIAGSPSSRLTVNDSGVGAGTSAVFIDQTGGVNDVGSGLHVRTKIADSTDNILKCTSTTSTTTRFAVRSDGVVTKPYQPMFQVRCASGQTGRPVNTTQQVAFNNEIFDTGGNFNSSTYTFTAPVTGKYQLNVYLRIDHFPHDCAYVFIGLVTSNRTVHISIQGDHIFGSSNGDYHSVTGSILTDLDVNDTAYVTWYQYGGSASAHIVDDSRFSGFLVG